MLVLRSLRYFRPERRTILFVTAMSLIAAGFEAGALVLLVPIASTVAAAGNEVPVTLAGLDVEIGVRAMIALAAGSTVISVGIRLAIARVNAGIATSYQRRVRLRIHQAFFEADWSTQAAQDSGRVLEMSGSMAGSTGSALQALVTVSTAAASLAIFVVLAIFVDLAAATAVAGCAVVLGLALRPVSMRVRKLSKAAVPHNLNRAAVLGEQVRFAREIRIYQAADEATRRMDRLVTRVARLQERARFYSSAVVPLYQGAGLLLLLGILSAATALAESQVVALGAIALLMLRSLSYGQQLQAGIQQLNQLAPTIEQLDEAVAELESKVADDGRSELGQLERLEFRSVDYRYPSGTSALIDVSFSAARGETIGVVGPSGSGKSTLAQLALRLRLPTAGHVLANGLDVAGFTAGSWYSRVAIVPQETQLLNATVAENIAFFRTQLTAEDVLWAARSAGIHDAITELDDGYETPIGSAARDLSGGQIQRIGIARALAGRPDLLVMDEPTSALDSQSEAMVQDTLRKLAGSMLLIIIAHRLSTLTICDRILVLEGGRLVATGPAEEILDGQGVLEDPEKRAALDLA